MLCSRLGGSCFTLAVLSTGLALAGCANHFESVVRRAEAARPDTCGGDVAVQKVGYGYRVSACEETRYYRCYFQRKSMGQTQCCYEVSGEDEASALVSFSRDKPETCAEFTEHGP